MKRAASSCDILLLITLCAVVRRTCRRPGALRLDRRRRARSERRRGAWRRRHDHQHRHRVDAQAPCPMKSARSRSRPCLRAPTRCGSAFRASRNSAPPACACSRRQRAARQQPARSGPGHRHRDGQRRRRRASDGPRRRAHRNPRRRSSRTCRCRSAATIRTSSSPCPASRRPRTCTRSR